MVILKLNIENLRSLVFWILLGLLIMLLFYSSFHATLYDDAKKKVNKHHDSFRSFTIWQGKFRFGLPIPIISSPENEEIQQFKKEYNRIITALWIVICIMFILFLNGN